MKTTEPLIVQLARKPGLDQETAYTICQLIDAVGWGLTDDWDWQWLNEKLVKAGIFFSLQ